MATLTQEFDILIIGAGPTGLILSACLVRWGYAVKHIDIRAEPTQAGRADGIQPRSLDLLCNMDLEVDIMARNPGRFGEVAFWDPGLSSCGISRTGSWASCPRSIGARYPFTTTLHQGLIEEVLIGDLKKRNVDVQRPWYAKDFNVATEDQAQAHSSHPVRVMLQSVTTNATTPICAKYLFSGEGARSSVRNKLGIQMSYKDSSLKNVWGVVDARVSTNFPDIQIKCNIHSEAGSMMLIPREAGLVRFYVQIAQESATATTLEDIQELVQRVLAPYELQWEYIDWYSCYRVRQGIAEHYSSQDHRVFLGGDACHTHSPKAGQGMNTAFLDAQNLAWKIHAVEGGFALRSTLSTYETERMCVAQTLLDFDSRYNKLFAQQYQKENDCEPQESEFVKTFQKNSEFTSGYGVAYPPNVFNVDSNCCSSAVSHLFLSFPNETRLRGGHLFPPADVIRVVDAAIVHLEQAVPLNGAFRIYIFGGCPQNVSARTALADFAKHSLQPRSYLSSFLRSDGEAANNHDMHCPHSRFYTFCTILATHHADVDIDTMLPSLLATYSEHVYVDNVPNEISVSDESPPVALTEIQTLVPEPAVVVVRPDGYVGCAVRLIEGSSTVLALNMYFARFVSKKLCTMSDE